MMDIVEVHKRLFGTRRRSLMSVVTPARDGRTLVKTPDNVAGMHVRLFIYAVLFDCGSLTDARNR